MKVNLIIKKFLNKGSNSSQVIVRNNIGMKTSVKESEQEAPAVKEYVKYVLL